MTVILIFNVHNSSSEWPKIHDTLFRALGKAAKVALGKEPSKVQSYISSGELYSISVVDG